jgi:hypothetical protein
MASEIHLNDIGTRFLATIKDNGAVVNVSGAPYLNFTFKKPDDSLISRSATIYTNGTDGKIYYDTVAGDLNQAGLYKLQGQVALASGTFYTDIYNFTVHCNL